MVLLQTPLTSDANTFTFINPDPANELWLNPGFVTYHFKNNSQRNDSNYGIGAEYRFSTVSSFAAGVYNNSFRETSHYVGWDWQPVEAGPLRLGAVIGGINGYSNKENGRWFASVIPIASFEHRNIGASLLFVPPYAKASGALSLQLKLNIF